MSSPTDGRRATSALLDKPAVTPSSWAPCLAMLMLMLSSGCSERPQTPPRQRVAAGAPATYHAELFLDIADKLGRLEEVDTPQEASQLLAQLDFWAMQKQPQIPWQRDAMLDALADKLRRTDVLKSLDSLTFRDTDLGFIEEVTWLRDVANQARGGQRDELPLAVRLFDWTVRNIQLETEPAGGAEQAWRRPLEVLMLGRGRAAERAWVFALLARQQQLDVVLLDVPLGDAADAPRRPLAALLGRNKQLYLFDPQLGLPIPGKDEPALRQPPPGDSKPPAGDRLTVSVASLQELAADNALLRKLDLDAEHPYPLKAEHLRNVVPYIEASPPALTRRLKMVQSRLIGKQQVVLSVWPNDLAARLAGSPNLAAAQLWSIPFLSGESALKPGYLNAQTDAPWRAFRLKRTVDVIESDPDLAAEGKTKKVDFFVLRLARMRHLRGRWDGERSAKSAYMVARAPQSQIAAMTDPNERTTAVAAKQCASYWLGLLQFEQGEYAVAIDYFDRQTLKAWPNTSWTDGAHYNLGRAHEAAGALAEAIAEYESDNGSPQSHGNKLRARWLKERRAAGTPTAGK